NLAQAPLRLNGGTAVGVDWSCTLSNAPGQGRKWRIVLRLNGADTGHACEIANTQTSCIGVPGSFVNFAEGDLIDGLVVPTNTPAITNGIAYLLNCAFAILLV